MKLNKLTLNRETLCSLTDQLTEQVNAGGTAVSICVLCVKPTVLCHTLVCPIRTSACPVLTPGCPFPGSIPTSEPGSSIIQ